jgi:lipopolysaccharide exporter
MALINLKGDLFAATVSLAGAALVKLVSSLVLTRLLYPEAYGIMTVVASIATIVELISDIGVVPFFIRDKNAEEPRFINTLWTLRLLRGCANCAVLFACAPWIATLYDEPVLVGPIRAVSLLFVFYGLESMSFALAVRRQRARILNYSELACGIASTSFVIGFSYVSRDHWGMIYGMLLNRLLLSGLSYAFYRDMAPKLQINREAARDLFGFTKYVMPSSIVSLLAGQFDKVIFLRLFDLHLLGLYGLAGSVAGMVDSLTTTVTRRILYPRCTHEFRSNPANLRTAYYGQNVAVFALILFMPAAVGGAAHFIVGFLYDERYAFAGTILQALMVQSVLQSFSQSAEVLVVAQGHIRATLIANLLRLTWMTTVSLAGYHFFGFLGFLYGYVLNPLPGLLYNLWRQGKEGLLVRRFELLKCGFVAVVFVAAFAVGDVLNGLGWTIRKMH